MKVIAKIERNYGGQRAWDYVCQAGDGNDAVVAKIYSTEDYNVGETFVPDVRVRVLYNKQGTAKEYFVVALPKRSYGAQYE